MRVFFSDAEDFLKEATDDVEHERVWLNEARLAYRITSRGGYPLHSVCIVAGYQLEGGDLVTLEDECGEVNNSIDGNGGMPLTIREKFKRLLDRLKKAGFTVRGGMFVS